MFETIMNSIAMAEVRDYIDILLVAFMLYKLMRFLRNTNAQKLFQGLVILLVLTALSGILQLSVVYWILTNVMQVGIIALVIIFQP